VPNTWTLIRVAAYLAAGFLVERVVTSGWKVASGHQPPVDPEDIDSHAGEVVAYAVVSGALIALARVIAVRSAARAYTKYTAKPIPKSA
jgi:hypothetical protein